MKNVKEILIALLILVCVITIIGAITVKATEDESTTYYINTAQELWDFAAEVNSGNTFYGITVKLTADITLDCNSDKQWIPIGSYKGTVNGIPIGSFRGIFDGQSHSISGIYINTDEDEQGLFGYNTGTIKNLIIKECNISSSGSFTGAVAGRNSGSIIDVTNESTIIGGEYLGGISGNNGGEIISCQNKGTIIGLETITGKCLGGISGGNGGTIINSNNTGTIDGNESKGLNSGVGGIVGRNAGTIKECINTAKVDNPVQTGGIVGLNDVGIIIDCSNTGEVIGEMKIGGIAGKQDYRVNQEGYTLIMNCSNSGNIKSILTTGTSYVGGIVGESACATEQGRVVVNRCNNTGLIEGSVYTGGISGFQGDGNGGDTSYIKKCWNSGTVKSYVYGGKTTAITYSYTGGIVGCNNCGYIDECYNSGEILGAIDAGGVAGLNSGIIINSYNLGSVNAIIDIENSSDYQLSKKSLSSAGGIVGFNYDTIKNCYNAGKVVADYASGLVSSNNVQGANHGTVENCYTVGNIEAIKSSRIIGSNYGTINNCYYLDTTYEGENQDVNIIGKSSEDMKKAEFVELLNSTGNNFKMDSENTNNGYPILNEKETVKIIFEDKILYNKVVEILLHKIENYNDETMTIEITQENLDTVTILELNNYRLGSTEEIQNISGIKNFTNLITLKLSFNSIRDISELQYLTKLEYLDLGANNISNIDAISQLSELQSLYLYYNDIETVPILNCSNLTYLDLRTNKIKDITNLANLANLEELYLYNYTYSGVETDRANEIIDISALEGLENLTTLDVRNQKFIQAGVVGEEINLPLIFIQAKNEQSVAYTENEFITTNCRLSTDGTKIILGKDTTREACIKISGGVLSGSSFVANVESSGNTYGDYEYWINENEKTIRITSYKGSDNETTIPSNINGYTVTSIGAETFKDSRTLETITIPEYIVDIGNSAFQNANSLTNINVDEENKQYVSENGVLFNRNKTELICYPCGKNNENYIIPDSVENIVDYAFYNCDKVKNVTISRNVTRIGNRAFMSCEKLTSIVIPKGLTCIETFAFANCTSVTTIYIPYSVESIGNHAFEKHESLTIYCNSDSNAEEYAINNNITYVIDDASPVISSVEGNPTETTTGNVTLTINASDSLSGLAEKAYSFDNGITWQENNRKTYEQNTSEIIIKVRDNLGNVETYKQVINIENIIELTVISITTPPRNTSYIEGQSFNPAGMIVTATYNDGTTKEVTNYTVTDGNNLTAGKTSVTISYTENGVTKTTTQGITVKVVTEIAVTTAPTKTNYIAGQNFDKTGMVVTATYGDGSTEEITDYTVVNGTNLKCGEQKVTIQYNGNTEIKTEVTVSVEHAEVIDQAVAATCETEGKTEGKHCSVCNKILVAQATEPALGHNYENGVCTRCGEKESKVEVISEKYEVGEKYITKINSKTTAKNLKENLQTNTNNITIYNKDNEEVEENGIIGTGSKIELQLGNETITLILVITGDTSGDGEATFSDILQINKHRLNKTKLEEEYLKAGDVTGDGKVDFSDILQINKYRLGKISSL